MKYATLDKIVKRILLQKGYPLHWYVEYLTHASTCLRELTLDSLKIINTTELTLNSYYAADLPCDYVDYWSVGIPVGQLIKPVTEKETITPLVNKSATGQPIPYADNVTTDPDNAFFWPTGWWFYNINGFGEYLGGLYGIDTAAGDPNGFKVFPERNQIQFTESFTSTTAVMQYISDGQSIDNATQIPVVAQITIEDYINWKRSPNADIDRSPEAITYNNSWRKVRSRVSGLTLEGIKQTMYSAYKQTPKN